MTIQDSHEHPIVIFDGVCNLCEDSVAFIIGHDRDAKFRFVAAQTPAGQALQAQYGVDAIKEETVILIKNGRVYTRSDAGVEIAKDLDGPWQFLGLARYVPRFLRNRIYTGIAGNRYRWFGKKRECMVPDEALMKRFIASK